MKKLVILLLAANMLAATPANATQQFIYDTAPAQAWTAEDVPEDVITDIDCELWEAEQQSK